MKKILTIVMMMMFVACGAPQQNSKKETVAGPPPPGPTQEEVLKEAKEKQEMAKAQEEEARAIVRYQVEAEIFGEWWNTEREQFQRFLMTKAGAPILIRTVDVGFMDDYQLAVVHIRTISPLPNANGEAYIIVTRPGGEWNINAIVGKSNPEPEPEPELDTRLEADENHEQKL